MHAAAYKVTAPASDAVAADATESCHPMHAVAYKPPHPLLTLSPPLPLRLSLPPNPAT
jgi:hypothetical protein